MPAAFYEFTVEQSSDFVSTLKVLNPKTGKLFKFLPPENTPAWTRRNINDPNSPLQLNFDVPEEIKLVYPNDNDSFGWLLKNTPSSGVAEPPCSYDNTDSTACLQSSSSNVFLAIRMQMKPAVGAALYDTRTSYLRVYDSAGAESAKIKKSNPGSLNDNKFFDIRVNNLDHNILMTIPGGNDSNETTNLTGKYLYDIELEYRIGKQNSVPKPFVIRLLQGRFIFNPNVTT